MAKSQREMDRLKPTFEALYKAVERGDVVGYNAASTTLLLATSGSTGGNPIVDPPEPEYPRITSAPDALARLLDKGVTWDGRKMFTAAELVAGVANLRRKVDAWCGDTLKADSVKWDPDPGFGASFYGTAAMRLAEAERRWRELRSAKDDLRRYIVGSAPSAPFARLDPEGPIDFGGAPLQAGTCPTGGLQEFIDDQIEREKSGKPSGM